VHRTLRPEYFQQPDFVKDKLAEQLEKLIPVAGPIRRTKPAGAHVIALVGPTGVGKTTTIAKLAANLKVKEHRRVGFITIDTYRIAAVDQLKRYADILGAPLHVVHSADEIGGAIGQMSGIDFILIDTAGRSPNDTLKIGELRHFIRTAGADEVHLVLSMTSSRSSLELAAERFGDVNIDKVIFTKLDEAANTGLLPSLVRTMNKSVSYITTGQDVPADIEPANARRIAQLILGSDV
jgi:flagellar biosynthesis protein FlhF